jgi:fatty-acyl-CoA synthase
VVLKMPGVREALVYGVTVPGGDGRAGMAALVVDEAFDPKQFRAQLAELLPSYARPVFLRLLPQMPITSTFKPIARDLIRTSFDPSQVADPLFFDSAAAGAYVALDAAAYAAILDGKVRL